MKSTRLAVAACVCLLVGLTVSGWQLSSAISGAPTLGATITQPAITIVHTRVLTKKVRGRVVTLRSGVRVVLVPLVVIHNLRCHPSKTNRCVRRVVVPAHRVPLQAAASHGPVAVAAPLVPVTVTATVTQTVTTPAVTVVQTHTTTETATSIITVTITVPLPPPGDSVGTPRARSTSPHPHHKPRARSRR